MNHRNDFKNKNKLDKFRPGQSNHAKEVLLALARFEIYACDEWLWFSVLLGLPQHNSILFLIQLISAIIIITILSGALHTISLKLLPKFVIIPILFVLIIILSPLIDYFWWPWFVITVLQDTFSFWLLLHFIFDLI